MFSEEVLSELRKDVLLMLEVFLTYGLGKSGLATGVLLDGLRDHLI